MTENKRFEIKPSAIYNNKYVIHDSKKEYTFPVIDSTLNYMFCKALNELSDENEQLQNQIDELEDDNEKYSKSLDKLEDYTKRFIPTKCLNEFKDCKTNRYYWLDHEGNLEGALELLNLMDCENEKLKQYKQSVNDVLKSWSQKNLTAKQLQVVLAIMEELNVIGDV